jgi:hypothetical protein
MKSIETASQTFLESIQEAMDQCQHVGIFLYLTKVKDILNHNTCLIKWTRMVSEVT